MANYILQNLTPADFAYVANYTYDVGPLPKNVKYLDSIELSGVRFAYFELTLLNGDKAGFLGIRGTVANEGCLAQDALILTPGVFGSLLMDMTVVKSHIVIALSHFEPRYGKCRVATGHSLGGKYLSGLPKHIVGISFNGFTNSYCENVISFRVRGDIADACNTTIMSATDIWIWPHIHSHEPPVPAIFNKVPPMATGVASLVSLKASEAHKLTTMITSIQVEKIGWTDRCHSKANSTLNPDGIADSVLDRARAAYHIASMTGGVEALSRRVIDGESGCNMM